MKFAWELPYVQTCVYIKNIKRNTEMDMEFLSR